MPIQRWRYPVVLRVKSAVFTAAGAAITVVFFPLWLAVPVAALLGAWGLSVAVLGAEVSVDTGAGVVLMRVGLITRRIPVTSVTAVLVDGAKVSVARANGGEISVYAWRKSPLDGWLRVPAVASDIGHAIASAVALASDPAEPGTASQPPAVPGSSRSRSVLATAVVGCAGLAGVISASQVRVSWPDPVMKALGALLALALGVTGLFYLLLSLWLLLTRSGRRSARGGASTA